MHEHLEEIVADFKDLCIVNEVRELGLQFFVDDLRANKLLIARLSLGDQLVSDDPCLLRIEKYQDLSVCLVFDLAGLTGAELVVELEDLR